MSHHSHDHPGDGQEMPFDEKLLKLLSHWIRHNDDHAENYRQWAGKARAHRLTEAGDLLDKAADMTDLISRQFKAAADAVHRRV